MSKMTAMRSQGTIIELDAFTGIVLVTVGIRCPNSSAEVYWVGS